VTNEAIALAESSSPVAAAERVRRTAVVAGLYGNLGAYKLLIENARRSTLSEIKRAMQSCETVIVTDPSNGRALAILSLGHYLIGTNPWYIRLFNPFFGVEGSVSKGILELERGSRVGDTDAQFILKGALTREKRYGEALPLLRRLSSTYPRNIAFKLQIGQVAVILGLHGEVNDAFRTALELVRQDTKHDPRYTPTLVISLANKSGVDIQP
jgi:hypothetical protein